MPQIYAGTMLKFSTTEVPEEIMKRPFDRVRFDGGGRGGGGIGGRGGGGGRSNDRRGKNFFKIEFAYDPWSTIVQEKIKLNQLDESEMSKDYGLLSSTVCGTSDAVQSKAKVNEKDKNEAVKAVGGDEVANNAK